MTSERVRRTVGGRSGRARAASMNRSEGSDWLLLLIISFSFLIVDSLQTFCLPKDQYVTRGPILLRFFVFLIRRTEALVETMFFPGRPPNPSQAQRCTSEYSLKPHLPTSRSPSSRAISYLDNSPAAQRLRHRSIIASSIGIDTTGKLVNSLTAGSRGLRASASAIRSGCRRAPSSSIVGGCCGLSAWGSLARSVILILVPAPCQTQAEESPLANVDVSSHRAWRIQSTRNTVGAARAAALRSGAKLSGDS